jgi:glutathione S-transferase
VTGESLLMLHFERRRTMRLIDTNDPVARRKAAIHYTKIAAQAQRQAKRRRFFRDPHFTFADMIFCALLTAMLAATVGFYFGYMAAFR